jgi:hypothetical protein
MVEFLGQEGNRLRLHFDSKYVLFSTQDPDSLWSHCTTFMSVVASVRPSVRLPTGAMALSELCRTQTRYTPSPRSPFHTHGCAYLSTGTCFAPQSRIIAVNTLGRPEDTSSPY